MQKTEPTNIFILKGQNLDIACRFSTLHSWMMKCHPPLAKKLGENTNLFLFLVEEVGEIIAQLIV
ncbi:MAG: hypothetical protein WA919_01620 [Coleofasciculaceae cyanobacterium]